MCQRLTPGKHIDVAAPRNVCGWQRHLVRGVIKNCGVVGIELINIIRWCCKQVCQGKLLGQCGVRGKVGGMNQAHHVAIDIALASSGDTGGCLAAVAGTPITAVVATQLYDITGCNVDADRIGIGSSPAHVVLIIFYGQSVGVDDVDGSFFHGLEGEWCFEFINHECHRQVEAFITA